MNFTFGIITGGNNEGIINQMIDSIENQHIPNYEIIIVGTCYVHRANTTVIPFYEAYKPMWITKKKNIITDNAKYENIVYLHDYIVFCDGWYEGFLQYGNNFDLCMNKIVNPDGSRFRDWHLGWGEATKLGLPHHEVYNYLLPYDEGRFSKYMYFSGSYWVAKKHVMIEFPLNEDHVWGSAEDIEWSNRVREKYTFKMNANSMVKLLKYKDPVFHPITEWELECIRSNYERMMGNS